MSKTLLKISEAKLLVALWFISNKYYWKLLGKDLKLFVVDLRIALAKYQLNRIQSLRALVINFKRKQS